MKITKIVNSAGTRALFRPSGKVVACMIKSRRMHDKMPKVSVRHNAALLLPILFVAAFSSSPVLASSVFLGTATIYDDLNAETCFADCDRKSFESFTTGNGSVATPDSATQSTAVLSKAPSISVRSEADTAPAGGLGSSTYLAGSGGQVTLHYYFSPEGPQNTTVPVLVKANANVSVTGTVADTGFSNFSDARLYIGIDGIGQKELLIQNSGTGTRSASLPIDGTYYLQTNVAYEVLMQIKTASNVVLSDLTNIVTTASIDPSFQIGPGYTDYSIVFSDGLTDTTAATPIPAALPLFASGLGGFGYLVRRRRRKIAFAA